MIGISKLYCGTVEPSDALRYGRDSGKLPSHLLQFSKDKKPVVVWNVGQRCNLKCVHCYSQSKDIEYTNELSTKEAKAMSDGLAEYGAPVLLVNLDDRSRFDTRKNCFGLAQRKPGSYTFPIHFG